MVEAGSFQDEPRFVGGDVEAGDHRKKVVMDCWGVRTRDFYRFVSFWCLGWGGEAEDSDCVWFGDSRWEGEVEALSEFVADCWIVCYEVQIEMCTKTKDLLC